MARNKCGFALNLMVIFIGLTNSLALPALAECESNSLGTLVHSKNNLLGKWSNTKERKYIEFRDSGEVEMVYFWPSGDSSHAKARYEIAAGGKLTITNSTSVFQASAQSNELKVTDSKNRTTVYVRGVPVLKEIEKYYDTLLVSSKVSVPVEDVERSIRKLEPVDIALYDPIGDVRTIAIRVEKDAATACLALCAADKNFTSSKLVIPQVDRMPNEGHYLPVSESYDELMFDVKPGVEQSKVEAIISQLGGKIIPNRMAVFPRAKLISAYLTLSSRDLFEFLGPHLASQSDYSYRVKAVVTDPSALQKALLDLNATSLNISKVDDKTVSVRVTAGGPRGYRSSLGKARANKAFSEVYVLSDDERKHGENEAVFGTYIRLWQAFSPPYNSLMMYSKPGISESELRKSIKRLGTKKYEIRKYSPLYMEFDGNQLVKGAILAILDSNFEHVQQNFALAI